MRAAWSLRLFSRARVLWPARSRWALPRRFRAFSDFDPDSAVYMNIVSPASAETVIVSNVRLSSPTIGWWNRLAPVSW
jgi:hypothetical protein